MNQYWFTNCNKFTTVNSRKNRGGGSEAYGNSILSQFFCKAENYSKIKAYILKSEIINYILLQDKSYHGTF